MYTDKVSIVQGLGCNCIVGVSQKTFVVWTVFGPKIVDSQEVELSADYTAIASSAQLRAE